MLAAITDSWRRAHEFGKRGGGEREGKLPVELMPGQ